MRRNKYGNHKCSLGDMKFDSKKERQRYLELEMMLNAGLITNLKRQVPFELLPAFYHEGKKVQGIKYVADFVYDENGQQVIEDVKSDGTRSNQVYRMKKKWMLSKGLEIKEI